MKTKETTPRADSTLENIAFESLSTPTNLVDQSNTTLLRGQSQRNPNGVDTSPSQLESDTSQKLEIANFAEAILNNSELFEGLASMTPKDKKSVAYALANEISAQSQLNIEELTKLFNGNAKGYVSWRDELNQLCQFMKNSPADMAYVSGASAYFATVLNTATFQSEFMRISPSLAGQMPIKITAGLIIFLGQTHFAQRAVDVLNAKGKLPEKFKLAENDQTAETTLMYGAATIGIYIAFNTLMSLFENGNDLLMSVWASQGQRELTPELVATGVAAPALGAVPFDMILQAKSMAKNLAVAALASQGYPNEGLITGFLVDQVVNNGYNFLKFYGLTNAPTAWNDGWGNGPDTIWPLIDFSETEAMKQMQGYCETYLVYLGTCLELPFINDVTVGDEIAAVCGKRKDQNARECADKLEEYYSSVYSNYPDLTVDASLSVQASYQQFCDGTSLSAFECAQEINFEVIEKINTNPEIAGPLLRFCSDSDTAAQNCAQRIVGYMFENSTGTNPFDQANNYCYENTNSSWNCMAEQAGVRSLEGNLGEGMQGFMKASALGVIGVAFLMGAYRNVYKSWTQSPEKIKAGYLDALDIGIEKEDKYTKKELEELLFVKNLQTGLTKIIQNQEAERIDQSIVRNKNLGLTEIATYLTDKFKTLLGKPTSIGEPSTHLELREISELPSSGQGPSQYVAASVDNENQRISEEFEPPLLDEQEKQSKVAAEYITRLSDSGVNLEKFIGSNETHKSDKFDEDRQERPRRIEKNKSIHAKRDPKDRKGKGPKM